MQHNDRIFFYALVGLGVMSLIMALSYGLQYHFAGTRLVPYFAVLTAPFLVAVALTSSGFLVAPPTMASERLMAALPWAGYCMMSVALLLTAYFYDHRLPTIPLLLIALVVVALGALVQSKWGARGTTLFYLAAISVLYVVFVVQIYHKPGANMLEIIEAASVQFEAGHNPYRLYASIAPVPFSYLPALWLPYALPHALGWDVRVVSLVCFALIVLIFERGLKLGARGPALLSVTFYPILFSPQIAQMIIHGHIWPYWVAVLAAAMLLYRGKLVAAALLVGLALAARQSYLFVLLPLAVFMWHQRGFGRMLGYAAVSLVVYAVIVVPFSMWAGPGFWTQMYLSYSSATNALPALEQLNASTYLFAMGAERLLLPIQVALIVAWSWVAWRGAARGAGWFAGVAGLVYIWAVLFNPYVVRYLYLPGMLLLAMSLATQMAQADGNRAHD
ncbi:hypothetical protein [Sulfuriferula sp.]|uniref:hypothetical protein n=1 Tax=Sulfuriferula sp. TaxID=2025307 RepID=UPI002731339F|nr:hypothetical protein [Sulfuriferula sp.]MDP2025286.1 hypothetical protein [Sulfuriferula sp.]